jgi:hypothetical protein
MGASSSCETQKRARRRRGEMPILPEGRYAPPVHMIKLTATQEITPYKWVHRDEER